MEGRGYFLQSKSDELAARIIKMYNYIKECKKEHIMSKQVLRSGTSIGANIAESRYAQSTPDYVSKLSIALKEANETLFWTNCLYTGNYLNNDEHESINNDIIEIIKLLTVTIKKVKARNGLT